VETTICSVCSKTKTRTGEAESVVRLELVWVIPQTEIENNAEILSPLRSTSPDDPEKIEPRSTAPALTPWLRNGSVRW
jgi:hypothetical protein